MSFVYYEGSFLPIEQAAIPVTDRGFLFGDGAYATIQVSKGKALFLEEHLQRLQSQCSLMHLRMPPLSVGVVEELVTLNQAEEGVWRLKVIVTGGDHPALHLPLRAGRLLLLLKPYEAPPSTPIRVGLFPHPLHLCHASYKSLAHLNRLYVMEEAQQQGVDDCLTLTEQGTVLELAFGNLFWIVNNTLFTPSRQLPLYFGVMLTRVLAWAEEEGYRIEEVTLPLAELPEEAEYYRTSSMSGVRPICEIAGVRRRSANRRDLLTSISSLYS